MWTWRRRQWHPTPVLLPGKIPWMEEPGRLQSMGSLRVGHDWATSLSLFTFHFHALEKEMATHSSILAWRIPGTREPVYGVAQSRTWLKRLSSSSSSSSMWTWTSDLTSRPQTSDLTSLSLNFLIYRIKICDFLKIELLSRLNKMADVQDDWKRGYVKK